MKMNFLQDSPQILLKTNYSFVKIENTYHI